MDKSHILEVAESLFFAKRQSDVKLDTIAHDLGMKKASLYYYFRDKNALFFEALKYSQEKFLRALEAELLLADVKHFIYWYLTYPAQEKNLFAVTFQQNIIDDVRIWMRHEKERVLKKLELFFQSFGLPRVTIYIFMNLLEKLASNNCAHEYCLPYSTDEIASELEKLVRCRS